jgi:hypothetical protein
MNEATVNTSVTPDVPLVDVDDITPDEALLAEVRRTRITTPATRALLALVVIAGTFLAGAAVERWQHKTSSASSASSLIAQFRAAAAGGASGASGTSGASGASGASGTGGGAGGLFGGGGNGTFGTIKLVDGSNVYVQDAQGDTIKVTTKPSTTVSVTKDAKVSDLTAGTTVVVQGTKSADGVSMAATSISQTTGFGGGAFGRGGGRFSGG